MTKEIKSNCCVGSEWSFTFCKQSASNQEVEREKFRAFNRIANFPSKTSSNYYSASRLLCINIFELWTNDKKVKLPSNKVTNFYILEMRLIWFCRVRGKTKFTERADWNSNQKFWRKFWMIFTCKMLNTLRENEWKVSFINDILNPRSDMKQEIMIGFSR